MLQEEERYRKRKAIKISMCKKSLKKLKETEPPRKLFVETYELDEDDDYKYLYCTKIYSKSVNKG